MALIKEKGRLSKDQYFNHNITHAWIIFSRMKYVAMVIHIVIQYTQIYYLSLSNIFF